MRGPAAENLRLGRRLWPSSAAGKALSLLVLPFCRVAADDGAPYTLGRVGRFARSDTPPGVRWLCHHQCPW